MKDLNRPATVTHIFTSGQSIAVMARRTEVGKSGDLPFRELIINKSFGDQADELQKTFVS